MGLSVVTAPTQEPMSLVEAKDHLRETSSDQDGLIAGYILAAREMVESATHRRLITQTLDYTIDDGWPCEVVNGYDRLRIRLPVNPVQSVTSITYVDSSGSNQTLSSSLYVLRADGPVAYIDPTYGSSWPTPRCQPVAVTVRFVAGWTLSDVPNPLMQAMRMLVGHFYQNREVAIIGSTVAEIPMGVESLLSAYRVPGFG
jgi:uncharacterized phiE125 gp8 family phage protein